MNRERICKHCVFYEAGAVCEEQCGYCPFKKIGLVIPETYSCSRFRDNTALDIEECLQEKWDELYGFGTCAICSIAVADSEMYDTRTYPDTVHSLLKRWKGLNGSNGIVWKRLEWIFNILPDAHLYNRETKKHFDLSVVKPPAIITVDGILSTEEYDSHFIYLRRLIYDKQKLVNAEVFCPINGNLLFAPHFGEFIKENVYSIINLRKGD